MRLPKLVHQFSSPRYFYHMAGKITPWTMGLFLALATAGMYIGFMLAPTHSEQGESYRIIFIHVPSASNSLMVYGFMAGAGLIFLVWRIKLADVIAAASAPIGASFTLLALVTGSIWGKPTWGTWWQWDARLTSELILLFLYLGYMALRAAIDDQQNAARASAVLALVGVVNIPIIKFSVEWWNTLHQGATISKLSNPSIDSTMLTALLLMMAAFVLLFATTALVRARSQVLRNELRSTWVKALPPERRSWLPVLLPLVGVLAAVAVYETRVERAAVYTPSDLVGDRSPGTGNVTLQGTVESIGTESPPSRFVLSDGENAVSVVFNGQLPRFFRADWGARIEGRLVDDGGTFEADTVAALNVRDHRRYVVGAYSVATAVLLFNLLAPFRRHRLERAALARRIRREEAET